MRAFLLISVREIVCSGLGMTAGNEVVVSILGNSLAVSADWALLSDSSGSV